MAEIYDRLDPNDPNSKWDFTKYTPDVVVVNLFQNDASIMRQGDSEQFKAKFGNTQPTDSYIVDAYSQFIRGIRSKYPNAQIICVLGNMDATKDGLPWKGYIDRAVAKMNDPKIMTHFFEYKNTPGHPSAEEQQTMANDLIKYIDNHIKW